MRSGGRRLPKRTELVRIISTTHALRCAISAWIAMITKAEYSEPELWMSPTEHEADLTLRMVITYYKNMQKAWKQGTLYRYGIDAKVSYEEAKKSGKFKGY